MDIDDRCDRCDRRDRRDRHDILWLSGLYLSKQVAQGRPPISRAVFAFILFS